MAKRRFIPAMAIAGLVASAFWLPGSAQEQAIVLSEYRMDAAVQLARQELLEALSEESPARPSFVEQFLGKQYRHKIIAGTVAGAEVQSAAQRFDVSIPPLSTEEYLIQPLPHANPPTVIVVGGDALGVAYGLLRLAEDIRLERPYLSTRVPLQQSPDMTLRLVSDPLDPDYPGAVQALRWGYNAVMTEPWPSLVTYDAYNPAIYDPARQATPRQWVLENQQRAHAQIAQAKALHLKVLALGDVISFPATVRSLYSREVHDPWQSYCIERPRVRELLAAALDELFTTFPQLDGIVVRTGENYPLGSLSGNPPEDAYCGPNTTGGGMESRRATWEFLNDQVVRKHGKLLVLRTWELGDQGAHARPGQSETARSVLGAPKGITFSYKITETDFWRYNRLNQNLLQQGQSRMVELQAAREYEGKGAFPNYVGGVYGLGPPELPGTGGLRDVSRAGVKQAWVWAKGGGWDGPVLSTSIWLDANVYSISRLLWNAEADPQQVALDWARLRFGATAAPYIADVLARSPQAVVQAFYPACFAAARGPWTPNGLFVRDDIITGGTIMADMYQACKANDGWAQVLAAQREALGHVRVMADDLSKVKAWIPNEREARDMETSIEYERTLLESIHAYTEGMFLYHRFRDGGRRDRSMAQAALAAFDRLDEHWRVHTKVVGKLGGVATPYRDAGMMTTVNAARQDLRAP